MVSNINFTSLNNPIKSFSVKTKNGDLYFKEIDYTKPQSDEFITETSEFFIDNFSMQSSYPPLQRCKKDSDAYNQAFRKNYVDLYNAETKRVLNDPDTTMMIARGDDGKIEACILAEKLNYPSLKEDRTLFIDMIAVDPKYRHSHVGDILCDKVIESSKDSFTDCTLTAYNESVPFYVHKGFKKLSDFSDSQKAIDCMLRANSDDPKYTTIMTKPIQENEARWWTRI